MRLVFASDTRDRHRGLVVPDGDVFIHCGDFTMNGGPSYIRAFGEWVRALPHPHTLVIAGNQDLMFESKPASARRALHDAQNGLTYLQDSGVSIQDLKFWGSPWQPWFYDWAFNLQRGPQIARVWNRIPNDTDVLITHGPPMSILDLVHDEHVGCADLLDRVRAIAPRVHALGHIHEGAGVEERDGTIFVNASICDGNYQPTNPFRVLDVRVVAISAAHAALR